jgi:hypothetical protein
MQDAADAWPRPVGSDQRGAHTAGLRKQQGQAGRGKQAQRGAARRCEKLHSLCLPAVQQLGADLEHRRQEVAVAGLVLAPVLEVLEQRVQLVVGVALQVPAAGHGGAALRSGQVGHFLVFGTVSGGLLAGAGKAMCASGVGVRSCGRPIRPNKWNKDSTRMAGGECTAGAACTTPRAPVDGDVAPVADLLRQVGGVCRPGRQGTA